MIIDNQSPPGAWQRDWDARPHTEAEFRAEIRDMRDRIKMYLKEIDELREEVSLLRDTLYNWKAKDGCDR
jgi:hypothetical protein